jgi:hypothetical protein
MMCMKKLILYLRLYLSVITSKFKKKKKVYNFVYEKDDKDIK